MEGIYSPALVTLSILVGVFAAYMALDLAGRVNQAQSALRPLWLLAGALTMGLGIWSMHFIGMLAFSLPVPVSYDIALTLLSILLAVAGSGIALSTASGVRLDLHRLVASGATMGGSICAMHYTGMLAMHMQPAIRFDPLLVLCSIGVAVGASIIAIRLAFVMSNRDSLPSFRRKAVAALILGLAICGMHYTGMAAAHFAEGAICNAPPASILQGNALALVVSAAVLGLLAIMLAASVFNSQLAARTTALLHRIEEANQVLHLEIEHKQRAEDRLRRSEQEFRSAFEDASIGMALTANDGQFTRVNAALCAMLGYSERELLALNVRDITHPDDLQAALTALMQAVNARQRTYRLEKRYLHKDGHVVWTRLNVSLVNDAKGGISHTVGQVMDITESRRQHQRIMRLNRVHALLSGISSSIVRVHSRAELFGQACKLAVAEGGFVFAWAGTVNDSGDIEPVAFEGRNEGYLDLIRPALSGERRDGESPAYGVRQGRPLVVNDFAIDAEMAPLREAATARGYRSLASLPLMVHGRLQACFTLYSSEAGFFDAEEMELLKELSRDISYALELIIREEQMHYLSYYDPLTGLANRVLLLERIGEHLLNARKTARQLAIAIIDLDRFKSINEAWGQVTGDEVLKRLAERMSAFLASPTQLARVAGDRFVMVLTDVDQPGGLGKYLQDKLLGELGQPLTVFGQELRLSARIGLSVFPVDGEDAESLIKNAESALKIAKRGDEPVCFYTHHLSITVRQRMNLENRLRRAIKNREFLLHYQPKVDLASGRVTGVEALIRWETADMGLVPPLQFVPLLEETGLIRDVGKWIIEEAAATYKQWSAQMAEAPRIAVNVSPVQLKHPEFVPFLREAVTGGGIDIEVTESMMMDNVDAMFSRLHEIRAMGVRVGIDDFGTGYSSLSYLSRLPADTLKVDRSFVIKMSDSAVNVSLVATIISMAHSLNLKVTAEGVDSAEQLKFLRMLKCDEIQGYLFSKPVAAAQVAAVITRLASHPLLLNLPQAPLKPLLVEPQQNLEQGGQAGQRHQSMH